LARLLQFRAMDGNCGRKQFHAAGE